MTVTAHSESMLVATDTNAQHAWIAKLHTMQFFRTKYMGCLFVLHRHVTYTLFTKCTYKATFIKKKKEMLGHTHAPMRIQRHTQLSLHARNKHCLGLSVYSHFLQCPCHCYDTPVITPPDISCQTAFWLKCISYFLEALQAGYRPTDLAQFHRLTNKAASC